MRIVAFVFIFTLSGWISVSIAVEKPVDFRHGPPKVSENKRYLVHEDGTPFFYLGDTARELFHRLNREEADQYLEDRAAKKHLIPSIGLKKLRSLRTHLGFHVGLIHGKSLKTSNIEA